MCEVAHTSLENWQGIADAIPGYGSENDHAIGGVIPRTNLWNHNLPRAEIDQRSREARLRLELIVRLFILGHA